MQNAAFFPPADTVRGFSAPPHWRSTPKLAMMQSDSDLAGSPTSVNPPAASPSHLAPSSSKLDTTPNYPQFSNDNLTMPAAHHVLLLGGHGKVAQLLTPLLLRRGWDVTSVIRSAEQVPVIERLADAVGDKQQSGKLSILVRSLEEVKSEGAAKGVLDEVVGKGLDYVVWSAGGSHICLYCLVCVVSRFG